MPRVLPHARNPLGEAGYRQLLADIAAEKNDTKPTRADPAPRDAKAPPRGLQQGSPFG